jgi:molybdenum cofactor synthesis domain-containing protein
MSNFNAGIIVIGDEILSGRTKDTNSNFIAKNLIELGIQLDKIMVIHDDKKIIMHTVLEFHKEYNYVFTTGGIGPTHDDITAESIASAFNQKYCFNEQAFKILEEYYPQGEFNEGRQKMAKMPEKASLILNPLTAAPGFIVENVYVLPGVPEIMQKMFKILSKNIQKGKPKKIITINTNLYESSISKKLSEIQNKHKDCSIGSYPYFNHISKSGGINLVVSSWTIDDLDVIKKEIQDMISLLGGKSSIV